jgi:hypothetical protein
MNVELLRKIAAVIQEKPAEFDMNDWLTVHSCGTSYCIGGWACKMTGADNYKFGAAREALGLDQEEADLLFYCTDWPKQFHGSVDAWKPTPEQAAARIEHFIKTGGAE